MWLRLAGAIVPAILPVAAVIAGSGTPRLLALGDSYTIGEGVAADARWPAQLARQLQRHGVTVDASEIVAQTGWTTGELSAAMDAHRFHPPYALVTLQIGVNDQYRGHSVADYQVGFRRLLERAIALAGARPRHVIVVSIPDWGVTRFGRESGRDPAQIAREIDAYNRANTQIAQSLGVRYVDVTAASRDGGADPDLLVDDGLHPSAAMYARWVEAILPQARAVLSTR